jgi:hypothetical protein
MDLKEINKQLNKKDIPEHVRKSLEQKKEILLNNKTVKK